MKSNRDPETGLVNGVEYIFKDEAKTQIDWRRMVKPEYLAINTQFKDKIESQYGKSIADLPVTELEDKYLIILLAGLKELANLRGYSSVFVDTKGSTPDNCIVSTHITWIPNIETNGQVITYGDVAGANKWNTSPIGKTKLGEWAFYLETIAANRSFCRAVRSFLGIHVVAREEIGSSFSAESESSTPPESSPQGTLKKKCDSKKLDFTKLKSAAKKSHEKEKFSSDPETWEDWDKIPARDCWTLLGRIDEKEKSK
jgi:hypothetical protein